MEGRLLAGSALGEIVAGQHRRGDPAGHAARRLLQPERAGDDVGDDAGNHGEVGHDVEGEQQVADRHERNHVLGDRGDLAQAAEDKDAGEDRQHQAGRQFRY